MSYEVFKTKVNALVQRAGGGVSVAFTHDPERGKHYANCSDGTVIIGRESALKVTVRWNCGHQSMAAI